MKVWRIFETEIDRCYHQCPYFGSGMDGMFCEHPAIDQKTPYANMIISHPKCDTGFPTDCPLVVDQYAKDIAEMVGMR
jgi:hypothetical protein